MTEGRKIADAISGVLTLIKSDSPLIITSTGTVASTGASNDAIDGAADTAWTITNKGTIASTEAWGIALAGDGVLNNSGVVTGGLGGFETGGFGRITNRGTIGGGVGVSLGAGGRVTNKAGGSILGDSSGVVIAGGAGRVSNAGTITAARDNPNRGTFGVSLLAGGSVTNKKGAFIAGSGSGVVISGGSGTVTNAGTINGSPVPLPFVGVSGVTLSAGGRVINKVGGSIFGGRAGVLIGGGAGTVINKGGILGSTGGPDFSTGVLLLAGGRVANEGGSIAGRTGVAIRGGAGTVVNTGTISGSTTLRFSGPGVSFAAGGSVVNEAGASITGFSGVEISGGTGTVTNAGTISGLISRAIFVGPGVALDGGSVTNEAGGSISGQFAVRISERGTVTNRGIISGLGGGPLPSSNGVLLFSGGTVTNEAGASITESTFRSYAVRIETGSGTVTNAGTISGTAGSVLFDAATTSNRLIIKPGAVFNGAADATGAADSTIELARGTDAISGIGNGQFLGFDTLVADRGTHWTLTGANTIETVLDNGKLEVAGALTVTTAVDPDSTGVFQLDGGSILEVAAAIGDDTKITFETGSELLVDHVGLFGQSVGTRDYHGSLLRDFSGATIDLKDFGLTGLHESFSPRGGLLQLTNAASQVATLAFQTSSLGAGTFHFDSDGHGGVLITRA